MTAPVSLLTHRAIPAVGYDLHLYRLGQCQFAIALYLNRQINWQDSYDNEQAAKTAARQLADRHGCALIPHGFGELRAWGK